MISKLHCLRENERGASIIEMALVAPFLATLIVGMSELSRAYSDRLRLEQAAQRAIEKVQQDRSTSNDYSAIADDAAAQAGITKTSSNPAVTQWLECSGNGGQSWTSQGNNTLANQCPSDTDLPARYVSISIQKKFTPAVRSRYLGTDSNGQYTLTARAGIRIQ